MRVIGKMMQLDGQGSCCLVDQEIGIALEQRAQDRSGPVRCLPPGNQGSCHVGFSAIDGHAEIIEEITTVDGQGMDALPFGQVADPNFPVKLVAALDPLVSFFLAQFVNRRYGGRLFPDSLGRSGRWITSVFGTGFRMWTI